MVEFSKEGYTTASTPLEIAENAMPGSLNLELAPLALDTVVLRDGTVLSGNLTSVTGTGVAINVKGKPTKVDRGRVARVIFGVRASSVASTSTSSSRKKK